VTYLDFLALLCAFGGGALVTLGIVAAQDHRIGAIRNRSLTTESEALRAKLATWRADLDAEQGRLRAEIAARQAVLAATPPATTTSRRPRIVKDGDQ